jgi:hypothetical protein
METKKSRTYNVHVCKETVEPEKLCYEKQKDDMYIQEMKKQLQEGEVI